MFYCFACFVYVFLACVVESACEFRPAGAENSLVCSQTLDVVVVTDARKLSILCLHPCLTAGRYCNLIKITLYTCHTHKIA